MVVVVPTADFAAPPLLDVHVAVYLGVVSALPFVTPAVKVTVSGPVEVDVVPEWALTAVGAAGVPSITAGEAAESTLVCAGTALFVEVTLQVYVLPVTVPATVIAPEAELPVWVPPPFVEVHVAVLWAIVEPGEIAPGVNVTIIGPVPVVVEPETALTAVGTPGAVRGARQDHRGEQLIGRCRRD